MQPVLLLSAAPDFAEVYKFIGSVFDPGVSGHLRKLREMSAIDRETVSCSLFFFFFFAFFFFFLSLFAWKG